MDKVNQKLLVERKATFIGHKDCIYTLEKWDDKSFFSAGGDGFVVQWDIHNPETGKVIVKIPNSVYAMASTLNEGVLLVGQNFSGLHVIDVVEKKEVRAIPLNFGAIFDIKIWNENIIVACGDGTLIVLDLSTFEIKEIVKLSEKSARSIAVNTIYNDIAVGYSDHTIRVFDATTFKFKYEIAAHSNSVFTLKYLPDMQQMISGSRDARLKVWNVVDNYSLSNEIVAHMYAINNIEFSPDGNFFSTASMDKTIKIWDANAFELLKVIDRARHGGHTTSVNKLLWLESNNQLLSCSDDRTISLWDVKSELCKVE